MSEIDLNDSATVKARIAELEADIERDRARSWHEIDCSSAEGILQEIVVAYEGALAVDKKSLHKIPKRLNVAISTAKYFCDNKTYSKSHTVLHS